MCRIGRFSAAGRYNHSGNLQPICNHFSSFREKSGNPGKKKNPGNPLFTRLPGEWRRRDLNP